MEWINARDRQPNNSNFVFIRHLSGDMEVGYYKEGESFFRIPYEMETDRVDFSDGHLCWLDESDVDLNEIFL